MPRKKLGKPCVLLIESPVLKETLILALDGLASHNKKLKEEITANNSQLDKVRNMIREI